MASHFIVLTLTLTTILFLIPSAFSQSAPAPGPAGPINLTDILVKGGQYTSLLRLLNQTQVITQLNGQLNNSNGQGMTLLAPTDNAFNNLPAGTLNNLNNENKVKLALLHVLPKYYSIEDFSTVSNPVQTQAGGNKGSLGLNFTAGQGNQVNVSSGVVETRINNPLRQQFPFAVYSIDNVLLFANEAPAPEGSSTKPDGGKTAKAPSSPAADGGDSPSTNGGGRTMDLGVGLVGSIVMFCMAIL
ncbi:FAS1 domain-containing protein [Artemisia annua]|uniref:FAS1 domain-containing protein n=1 Tax=Artemisia annua TaxID=35608 RepID=A0A2U1M854_ARTAN|nr:FAS1 domain-containing protein [Artemisia annua]PWA57433.1 FAS1 domain-containing protein [Artemisia annua]